MYFCAFYLTLLEGIVLLVGAVILGITVHFFISSRKSLKKYLQKPSQMQQPLPAVFVKPNHEEQISKLESRMASFRQKKQTVVEQVSEKAEPSRDELISTLRQTITQQQKLLNGFLRKVEDLEDNGNEDLKIENEELRLEIHKLEELVDKKKAEAERAQQQAATAQSMAARIDDIVSEFQMLQERMRELEVQASLANTLEIELEETRESYEVVRKDVLKKQEQLEVVLTENQELKNQLHESEDKLNEANRQRLQLQKKVQFLQDLNNDLHNITEANKKLQNELRRIGELESMLTMIAEERDQLLRNQYNK